MIEVEKIAVYMDGATEPFYLHPSMFNSFVRWYARERGVSMTEASRILKSGEYGEN